MLYKQIACNTSDSNILDTSCSSLFIELIKPPAESKIAMSILLLSSISVLYLSYNSEEEDGPTATGTKVVCDLILISIGYFISVISGISTPKLYAYYVADPENYSKEEQPYLQDIKKEQCQVYTYISLWLTQIVSLSLELRRYYLSLQKESECINPSQNTTDVKETVNWRLHEIDECHTFSDKCASQIQGLVSCVALSSWLIIIIKNTIPHARDVMTLNKNETPAVYNKAILDLLNHLIFIVRILLRLWRVFEPNIHLGIAAAYLEITRCAIYMYLKQTFDIQKKQADITICEALAIQRQNNLKSLENVFRYLDQRLFASETGSQNN